ncbi:hypothetical protein DACRYDRAFT_58750 [Dacryopinax primogenitus]|uniref:Uncharacterized protein n=1 Tax=Dacryopinax primogenitus (strain DJM 731) TaxID=1858805 RepID=M5FWG8_DACPD|nr:uncharacterized protein DACRYDRAFT_58750 [Dacryopinax primogenitus]EJT97746.1 hypothetical protein DACRYDRAFT_58750 [Dacryopinax primogenitus]
MDGHTAHDPPPLLELNETEVLMWHLPDPPSYWDHDFGNLTLEEGGGPSYIGFMVIHVVSMIFAYFVFLPLAIALRGAKHPWHPPVNTAYLLLTAVGFLSGTAYKKLTPDLYEGSAHGTMGVWLLTISTLLSFVDVADLLKRAWSFVRSSDRSLHRLWTFVILGKSSHGYDLVNQPESYKLQEHIEEEESFIPCEQTSEDWPDSAPPLHSPIRETLTDDHSETTLHDNGHSPVAHTFPGDRQNREPLTRMILRRTFIVAEHILVVFAAVVTLSGMTNYIGICRDSYLNGCMAHIIKGSIFWFYGILTFARYCGAFSQIGWAWNRVYTPPGKRAPPSAEMIESIVIFIYGATNTWMERFGAAPGSPYTTKQIQHISIAVMFWFAGLMGMALESNTVRRLLSTPALVRAYRPESEVPQPWSYLGSFNPFPALCIGITGAAMSAHHQTYVFQVEIHALWGLLLGAFAVFRFLTYFFLWLRPPTSPLPSRPPTEALAAFTLACGGLTFILSTEEVTYIAMRNGKDDMMMFLNLVVAIMCLNFTWVLVVLGIRGWAVGRMARVHTPTKTVNA